jgi:hypothetical protein
MKGFKLSKISWLILSTGVFLVILVGLGVTRSQQLKEQSSLDTELKTAQSIADKVQTADLQEQIQTLQDQVDEASTQVEEARQRLKQTVISADVDEKFFSIARYSSVEVKNVSTSTISKDTVAGVELSKTTISTTVIGEVNDIVNFVINLNNGYPTGQVISVSISAGDDDAEEANLATGSIQMTVYSYEGQ